MNGGVQATTPRMDNLTETKRQNFNNGPRINSNIDFVSNVVFYWLKKEKNIKFDVS